MEVGEVRGCRRKQPADKQARSGFLKIRRNQSNENPPDEPQDRAGNDIARIVCADVKSRKGDKRGNTAQKRRDSQRGLKMTDCQGCHEKRFVPYARPEMTNPVRAHQSLAFRAAG